MKLRYLFNLLFVSIVFIIFISIRNLTFLGFSYDELLFVNASILKNNETFISASWKGIPIMVFDYIGALKSWLYYPIFAIFGVNNYSIRLPTMGILGLNLYLIYIIGIKYFDKSLILCLLIILSTDLSFVNLHVIDHGPSALETLLKLLCLYFISLKNDPSKLIKILIVLLLGVFNKLNFIWFVNALFIFYWFHYLIILYRQKKDSIYQIRHIEIKPTHVIFTFLLTVIFFIAIYKIQGIKSESPSDLSGFLSQIANHLSIIAETFINFSYYYNLGWHRPHFILLNLAYVFLFTILGLNIYWIITKRIKYNHPIFFVFVIAVLITIQIAITKQAKNVWHIVMLYPFVQLVILYSLQLISEQFGKFSQKLFYGMLFIWLGYNVKTQIGFQKSLSNESYFYLYQPEIANLIKFTNNQKEDIILTIGWGIQSQLLATDSKSKQYIELVISDKQLHFDDKVGNIKQFPQNFESVLIVENITGGRFGDRENFTEMTNIAQKYNLRLNKIKTIETIHKRPIYNIFKLTKMISKSKNELILDKI
jgi:hypothetical protein